MKRLQFVVGLIAAGFAMGGRANAQLPSGSDVNTAIPIYFQEMVNDLGDVSTAPLRVYSITLSKNQQISATLSIASTAPVARLDLGLWGPGTTSLAGCGYNCAANSLAHSLTVLSNAAATFTYTASTSGVYYLRAAFGTLSANYTLEVTSPTPPPPTDCSKGGNLSGQVDYITYSLTLIGAGLPDSASVGGTQLCTMCPIKAPQYPQIAEKMETAMGLNVPVSLCYDGTGNILQITLKHP